MVFMRRNKKKKQPFKKEQIKPKKKYNFDKLHSVVAEDKEIKESMRDWVDERGHVINKYIYGEKWRYHLAIRTKIFNMLNNMIREEQEALAKELGVELNSEDNEQKVVEKLLRFFLK